MNNLISAADLLTSALSSWAFRPSAIFLFSILGV
jgi:hypothetical protein